MELEGLADRTILVVGAGGGGIGTAITLAVAAAGARVIAVDRDEAQLDLTLREAPAGSEIIAAPCDASQEADLRAVIEREAAGPKALHGLVNVVGGLPTARWHALLDDDDKNFDALLDSNLRVALRSSRAFARVFARSVADLEACSEADSRTAPERGGSIVQLASIAAFEGMPYGAGYAASKAALLSLTRTMALEWAPMNLRVNAIAPGTVSVPRSSAKPDAEIERRAIPLGRRGRPKDVAGAVLFLLSDLATWITGQTIAVDGGASVKPSYLDDDGLPVFVQDEALRARLQRGK